MVKNTGTTTLSNIGVTDNKIASVSCPSSTLAPGASETCTGTYTVTQANVDSGSVTNTASAYATNPQAVAVTSATSSVTVEASLATSKASLTESSLTANYHASGNVIHYSFKVTNTGTETLKSAQITDNKAVGLSCPSGSFAPGASVTCTGSYAVTQQDISTGSVVNTAVGHATNPHAVAVTTASSSVTVDVTGLRIKDATLPTGTRSVSYSTQLTGAGGTGPYTFSELSGSNPLPPNLRLSSSGAITGKPTTAGTYTFTIQVKDSSSTGADCVCSPDPRSRGLNRPLRAPRVGRSALPDRPARVVARGKAGWTSPDRVCSEKVPSDPKRATEVDVKQKDRRARGAVAVGVFTCWSVLLVGCSSSPTVVPPMAHTTTRTSAIAPGGTFRSEPTPTIRG